MLFPLVTRRAIVEPCQISDVHGQITCMEALPGGRVRVWICQNRGTNFEAVARIVLNGLEWMHVRPIIGHWMTAHGFTEPKPMMIQ